MTDIRLVPLEATSGALDWTIKLDDSDYFDVKRVVLNFGAPITAEENVNITLKSGLGPLLDFTLLSVPLEDKSGVLIEDITTLMSADSLLIEFPNTDLVLINGYAVLERTKQNTSGMNTISKVSFPNHDGIVVPREKNGGVPVNLQDQTSPLVDLYYTQQIGIATTLASDVVLPTYQLTVTTVTGFAAETYVGLFSGVSGEARYYFGTVLSVAGSVLTMDTPINFEFEAGDPVARLDKNMDVNGSSTAQVFSIQGGGTGSTLEIDITQIVLMMECISPVALSLFGDLAALTRGIVLRRSDGTFTNYWNIRRNAEFELFGEWKPYDKLNPAQGIDGCKFVYSLSGQENHGVTARVGANESLDLIIQDNLEGLAWLQAIARGHEVTD